LIPKMRHNVEMVLLNSIFRHEKEYGVS